MDVESEILAANRRIRARIDENARAAFERIDPGCAEAAPLPSQAELLGMGLRQFRDRFVATVEAFVRGFAQGGRA